MYISLYNITLKLHRGVNTPDHLAIHETLPYTNEILALYRSREVFPVNEHVSFECSLSCSIITSDE